MKFALVGILLGSANASRLFGRWRQNAPEPPVIRYENGAIIASDITNNCHSAFVVSKEALTGIDLQSLEGTLSPCIDLRQVSRDMVESGGSVVPMVRAPNPKYQCDGQGDCRLACHWVDEVYDEFPENVADWKFFVYGYYTFSRVDTPAKYNPIRFGVALNPAFGNMICDVIARKAFLVYEALNLARVSRLLPDLKGTVEIESQGIMKIAWYEQLCGMEFQVDEEKWKKIYLKNVNNVFLGSSVSLDCPNLAIDTKESVWSDKPPPGGSYAGPVQLTTTADPEEYQMMCYNSKGDLYATYYFYPELTYSVLNPVKLKRGWGKKILSVAKKITSLHEPG